MRQIRRPRSSTIIAIALTFTLTFAACSSPTSAENGLTIRPAASSFVRTPAGVAEVPYVVLNAGDVPVVLVTRCGERLMPVVQRRERDQWVPHSGGACAGIHLAGPVAVAPGERRDDVTVVAEPGQYRLVLDTERGPVASTGFVIR